MTQGIGRAHVMGNQEGGDAACGEKQRSFLAAE
jgi:hypothetical protein